tara:strand:- start:373 stop:726 length:354 start_codon:yes stop_codon:yes gene_type:complete
MGYIYKNITTTPGELLLRSTELYNNSIQRIALANVSSNPCIVDLYLYRRYGNAISGYEQDNETKTEEYYYLFKNLNIPSGVTLQLERDEINIDHANVIHDLYIKTDNSIDLTIKIKK